MEHSYLELIGIAAVIFCGLRFVIKPTSKLLLKLLAPQPKKVVVKIESEENDEVLLNYPKFDINKLKGEQEKVYMWDPATMDYLGERKANTAEEVKDIVKKARVAQAAWKDSSFAKRRLLMRTMLRYDSTLIAYALSVNF